MVLAGITFVPGITFGWDYLKSGPSNSFRSFPPAHARKRH